MSEGSILKKLKEGATARCFRGECSCEIASAVQQLYHSSQSVHELRPDICDFTAMAFRCLRSMVRDQYIASAEELGLALGAIFDLGVSLLYAERMASRGWLYCPTGHPMSFYPYVKSCPRCGRIQEPAISAHKPGSEHIGRYNAICMAAVLTEFCRYTRNGWEARLVLKGHDQVDMLLISKNKFVLCEIKASPLSAFPLCVVHAQPLTEEVEGETRNVSEHTITDVHGLATQNLSLFIFGANRTLPLERLMNLRKRSQYHTDDLRVVVEKWRDMFQGYASRWQSSPTLRWFTFGCGGDVDDSKNAPGLDRTDDIKKGLYQAIKLTESYRMKCSEQRVRVGLISNVHPAVHYSEYLQGFEDALWTHETKLQNDMHDPERWKRVRIEDLSPFYDMILTLTNSWFRDRELEGDFSLERLYQTMNSKR